MPEWHITKRGQEPPSGGTFDTLTGVVTSVPYDIREFEGHCRQELNSVKFKSLT